MPANRPFEEVVAEHGPTVFRVCRAVLGPADAEDAWSETFLAALRAYPDLRPDSNIEAWLVTIAKRKAIDQHRRRIRRPVPVPADDIEVHADRLAVDPHEYDEVWNALETLPRKQRAAVAYHYLAGLPYAEVATLLDNTESAARRAAADGMRKLRAALRPSDQENPR